MLGQYDQSTLVYNVVLITVFIKLFFEIEQVSGYALLVVFLTIVANFAFIVLIQQHWVVYTYAEVGEEDNKRSVEDGFRFDANMDGVGDHSIFNMASLPYQILLSILVVIPEIIMMRANDLRYYFNYKNAQE